MHRDDHCRQNASTNIPPGASSSSLGYRAPTYASPSHSIPQHHTNMTTITPEAGAALSWADLSALPDGVPPCNEAVPRSVQPGASPRDDACVISSQEELCTGSLPETSGYSNVNIDIPLDIPSSLSMEVSHDGKVMELVARFESITDAEGSDASQAHDCDRTRTPNVYTLLPCESDAETLLVLPVGVTQVDLASHIEEETHSPRKPIPPQWKTLPRAPVLRTQLRGEEREKKRAAQGTSHVDPKSLRSPRSALDLSKATYLTKDATEVTGSDLSSPTAPCLIDKPRRNNSKSTVKSPAGSPKRSSPYQQSIKITLSPNRQSHLSTPSSGHGRAASSVSGDSVYHSALHSPVSLADSQVLSAAASPQSFVTAAELPKAYVPPLILTGADGAEQKTKAKDGVRPPPVFEARDRPDITTKAAASSRKTPSIKAAVPDINLLNPQTKLPSIDRRSARNRGSVSTSGSRAPTSPTRASRIPRMAPPTNSMNGFPALKRMQSAKDSSVAMDRGPHTTSKRMDDAAYASEARIVDEPGQGIVAASPHDIPLPETLFPEPRRQVKTVNSTGTTPIISRRTMTDENDQPDRQAIVESYLETVERSKNEEVVRFSDKAGSAVPSDDAQMDLVDDNAHMLPNRALVDLPEVPSTKNACRASTPNAKALPPEDPILNDPAIIYSRKKVEGGDMVSCIPRSHYGN